MNLTRQLHSTDNSDQPTCDGAQLRREINIVENVTITIFKYLLQKLPSLEQLQVITTSLADVQEKLDT